MAKHKKYERWRIYGLDVWGNVQDGYEVNDRYYAGFAQIPENATDRQILFALKHGLGSDSSFRTKNYSIDGDDTILFVEYRGKPVYQLERLE